MRKIYETGIGSVKMRAKYEFNKKNNCIDVLEIPYPSSIESIMKKAKDMDIYIVAGNHDPYITAGMYRGNWPENVHIFKDKPEVITRRDKGYRVWGCSFAGSYVNEGILSNADMSFLKMFIYRQCH